MNPQALILFAHVLAVVVWVGGMFFAHMVLRPTAIEVLEPPLRLKLWRGIFARFFPWVWAAVLLILATGFLGFAGTGMKGAPVSWHLMLATGCAMVAIYLYLFTVPYGAFKRAVDAGMWPDAAAALNRMRRLVATNLILGLATIAIATLGRGL
ncbi:MAG: CopD family protein [Rhodocyclaceae bacterium]|nr:CopD family protein [Rhodocyclaceae bacterium]